ncbi:MAG: translation initiation factor IF-2 subunit beta [Candidatus Aenigmatarchaeota archaeon]
MQENHYLELLRRAKSAMPATKAVERWEMPRAAVQTSGKRTIIRNFVEVAKALRRDPQHIAKYLFKELAVPGSVGESLELQGKFSSEQINSRLSGYAKEFVLCGECGKPDTQLLRQDRLWFLKCEACGARRPVRAV